MAEGRTLWSERYDRELEDVFEIQDEIARTIVTTLRSTLLRDLGDAPPVRYTANLTAYHLYLKGRYWWNRRTQAAIAEGIKYFERAIEEDASYALAYTGLADSYALQVDYRGAPVHEGMERARELARRALELDDTLAEAHTSLAWVTFIHDWDWPTAAAQFRRAIELNPAYSVARQWHSWFLTAMGRTEASLAEGRMATELDPGVGLDPPEHGLAALLRAAAGRGAGAPAPGARHESHGRGEPPAAGAGLPPAGAARRVGGGVPGGGGQLREPGPGDGRTRPGRRGEGTPDRGARHSRRSLRRVPRALRESGGVRHDARGSGRGAIAAFEWLDRAVEDRRGWLAYLKVEPLLDPLRGDPRFGRLLEKMRLA